MTIICPVGHASTPALHLRTSGASEVASIIETLTKQGLLEYSRPRTEVLISEIEQLVADSVASSDCLAISRETANAAIGFALVLPRSLPAPEIAPEADGEISFDWFGPLGRIFSVSIDAGGRLAYAGSFGRKSKVHGTEQLSGPCPPEIIHGISKAVG